MVYDVFLNKIKTGMEQALGKEYELSLHRITKNNGLILDGLCISKDKNPVAPAIYLNNCYHQYLEGCSLEEITQELLELYRSNEALPTIHPARLSDYSAMKSRTACRLINTAANETLLQDMPHIPWNDLSIVFYLFLQENDTGIMTAGIHTSHLNTWGISQDELFQATISNVSQLFPPSITSMDCILEDLTDSVPDLNRQAMTPFYVLSNTCGINGAICMLYPDVLKHFSEGIERDVLILPSSIHEVLLLPDEEDISYDELSQMVAQINASEVLPQDRLSNQIYRYSRRSDSIEIVSSCMLPLN